MTTKRYPWLVIVRLAIRALIALAFARLVLHRTRPEDILQRNARARQCARRSPEPLHDREMREACERVAFVIPRIAVRLPWRADCLVQAIAGQQMLKNQAVASEIVVGTAKQADGTFEAHAWLREGERIVLGGDISRFQPLLEPEREND